MAIDGERFEARNNSVISGGGGGSDIEAMAEELPLADGCQQQQQQSIETALGRFAEAAASNPTVRAERVDEKTAQPRFVGGGDGQQ